jgi:hypothetical protein
MLLRAPQGLQIVSKLRLVQGGKFGIKHLSSAGSRRQVLRFSQTRFVISADDIRQRPSGRIVIDLPHQLVALSLSGRRRVLFQGQTVEFGHQSNY